jgi:hypothetical protein
MITAALFHSLPKAEIMVDPNTIKNCCECERGNRVAKNAIFSTECLAVIENN